MLTPGGASKVLIELGEDDIVRLPHTAREGKDAERLPASHSCNMVSRTIKGAKKNCFMTSRFWDEKRSWK